MKLGHGLTPVIRELFYRPPDRQALLDFIDSAQACLAEVREIVEGDDYDRIN